MNGDGPNGPQIDYQRYTPAQWQALLQVAGKAIGENPHDPDAHEAFALANSALQSYAHEQPTTGEKLRAVGGELASVPGKTLQFAKEYMTAPPGQVVRMTGQAVAAPFRAVGSAIGTEFLPTSDIVQALPKEEQLANLRQATDAVAMLTAAKAGPDVNLGGPSLADVTTAPLGRAGGAAVRSMGTAATRVATSTPVRAVASVAAKHPFLTYLLGERVGGPMGGLAGIGASGLGKVITEVARRAEAAPSDATAASVTPAWETALRSQLEKLSVPPAKIEETVAAETARRGGPSGPAAPPSAPAAPQPPIPPQAGGAPPTEPVLRPGETAQTTEVAAPFAPGGTVTQGEVYGVRRMPVAPPPERMTLAQLSSPWGRESPPAPGTPYRTQGYPSTPAEQAHAAQAAATVQQQIAEGVRGPGGGMRYSSKTAPPTPTADLGDLSRFSTDELQAMYTGPNSIKSHQLPAGIEWGAFRNALRRELASRYTSDQTVAQAVGERLMGKAGATRTAPGSPVSRILGTLNEAPTSERLAGMAKELKRASPSTLGGIRGYLQTHPGIHQGWHDLLGQYDLLPAGPGGPAPGGPFP
jgi:hypothetical protein